MFLSISKKVNKNKVTPYLVIYCGYEHTHTSNRKLMCHTSRVWADACFREETLYAIHHQCEHTMLQRGNFLCHTAWVWVDVCFREETLYAIHHGCEQMHASGRKLYVPFIISVSTPITSENKCVMLHVVGLESPNIFKGQCYYFTSIHVIHCGCNYSHTIHSHLW